MLSLLIRELILPPGSLLLLLSLGLYFHKSRPVLAKRFILIAALLFYLLSTPLVAGLLAKSTETMPWLSLQEVRSFQPQAVVVLGTGVDFRAPEYQGLTVPTAAGLKRLQYATFLAKQLNLPIMVCGGFGSEAQDSEAAAMAFYLREVGLKDIWLEDQSETTHENAHFAASLAKQKGVSKVVVVTHAFHAKRAQFSFDRAGLDAIVAPTGFHNRPPWKSRILLVMPQHSQFNSSSASLRAILGELWYKIQY